MKIEPGAHVTPNVRLLRPLGAGGMGAVWVAEHLALGTEVAVKFLLGDFANHPTARARFSQEAAAASQVKSSHVVRIYDYGITETDVPFIVMEMLEGTDLAHRMAAEHKLPPMEMITIVSQLCKALASAHAQNVVHRDVKPENVFLTREGGDMFVKLLDFGVAKSDKVRTLADSHRSTMANESLGTPYYMSPEQFRSAKTIDARSDLWSAGVLVYEALTGTSPFVGETVGALAIAVNEAAAVPPSQIEPSLPAAFDAWFGKACARNPADRFQTARELSDALASAFAVVPPPAIDSGSHRRIVISHVDPSELADAERISLRDTSFSTSGAQGPHGHRTRTAAIAGALVVAFAVVSVAFVALRHTPRPATTSTSASTTVVATANPPTLDVESAPRTAAPAGSTTVIAAASEAPRPSRTSSVKPSTATSAASAKGASSSQGPHGRDIW
jgi:serine/threonine-protein kinase